MERTTGRPQSATEKSWHDALYRTRSPGNVVVSPDIRQRYLEAKQWRLFHLELMFKLAGDVAGKNALCVGCGDSNSPVLLALKGARVWAFDLSLEAIRLQRRMAEANGVASSIHLAVSSADQLCYRSCFFDVGFGSAILHHLPDRLVEHARELAPVVKPGGFALFAEPVSRSPMLRRIRALFPAPQDVSPLERPPREG